MTKLGVDLEDCVKNTLFIEQENIQDEWAYEPESPPQLLVCRSGLSVGDRVDMEGARYVVVKAGEHYALLEESSEFAENLECLYL